MDRPPSSSSKGPSEKTPKSGTVHAEVEALRKKLAEARENISLRTTPVLAVRLFAQWAAEYSAWVVSKLLRSPVTWLVVLPAAAAWCAAKYHFAPGLFTPPVCGEAEPGVLWLVELAAKEAGWWILLGFLSSVGFGTGLHSGLMFLFPHVMQVVAAAEACGTTVGLVPWYQHPCKLECSMTRGSTDGSTVTLLNLWLLVTTQCMLWGAGTAIGELPPYLISKAARLAGSKDTEFESELEEARNSTDVFSRMKIWTIDFTEKHGFFGVFLLASWPNAAFDMCGMCCGYLLMPFWTFFLACCLGKGVVKVNGQAVFFVTLFGSQFFQVLLSCMDPVEAMLKSATGKDWQLQQFLSTKRAFLVKQFKQQERFFPDQLSRVIGKGESLDHGELVELYEDDSIAKRILAEWDVSKDGELTVAELKNAASRTDGKIALGSLDPGASADAFKVKDVLKACWELFIIGLILFFVTAAINQVARQKQAQLDEAEVAKLEKKLSGKKD
jgi:membrane protein YqaA with SNARE-associated domain